MESEWLTSSFLFDAIKNNQTFISIYLNLQMEVLLTGATGFLGKSIQVVLSRENSLFSLSRTAGDYKLTIENEIPNFNQAFDLVIHAAGKAHSVPKTQEEKKQFYDVNVLGTQNLLKGLEEVGVPEQFVFISSVSVYGQEFGKNINEKHKLEAKDPYGLSKIVAETLVMEWCKKHNVVCTILRLPLLVGANPPGNLGAMIKGISTGKYLSIGGGKARKSVLMVQDIANLIPLVADKGGVYNVCDSHHPSFRELEELICKQLNKSSVISVPFYIAKLLAIVGDLLGKYAPINSDKLSKITKSLTFSNEKAKKELAWESIDVIKNFKI